MALLKLRPSYKDYLWGGHRLVEKYNKEFDGDITLMCGVRALAEEE